MLYAKVFCTFSRMLCTKANYLNKEPESLVSLTFGLFVSTL